MQWRRDNFNAMGLVLVISHQKEGLEVLNIKHFAGQLIIKACILGAMCIMGPRM